MRTINSRGRRKPCFDHQPDFSRALSSRATATFCALTALESKSLTAKDAKDSAKFAKEISPSFVFLAIMLTMPAEANLNGAQTLLVDADDTLWENNIYFERAIANFISFLNHHEYTPRAGARSAEPGGARVHRQPWLRSAQFRALSGPDLRAPGGRTSDPCPARNHQRIRPHHCRPSGGTPARSAGNAAISFRAPSPDSDDQGRGAGADRQSRTLRA